jgi:hypothetical protein
MRRVATVAVLSALMLASMAGTAQAAELVGDDFANSIIGTNNPDFIDGLGGDDLLVGRGGPDFLLGWFGHDHIVTGFLQGRAAPFVPPSSDFVDAGPGNDFIDSADLAGAPDEVFCGTGNDLVHAGVEDFVANDCEAVLRLVGF